MGPATSAGGPSDDLAAAEVAVAETAATGSVARDATQSASSKATSGRAWVMWGVAVGAYFVAVFHRTSLGVASLDAERRFHVGPSLLATFVAAQLALYAALQIPTGAMADRFGPRRMLTVALAFLATGEIVFAWGGGVAAALTGRALLGVGDGLTFINVLRLVQNWFPASRYGLLTSLTALTGAVGQLISTVPLRVALSHAGWEATFTTSAVVTAVVALAVASFLRDRPDARAARLPLRERPHMLRAVAHAVQTPGTWRGTWAHFALTGPFVVFTALWGYPFLVRSQHFSGQTASLILAMVVVTAACSAPLVGLLVVRAPRWRARAVTACGLALVGAWTAALSWGAGRVPGVLLAAVVITTGLGASVSVIAFDMAREANPPERGGTATGVANIGGFVCAVAADLVVGWLLDAFGHGGQGAAGYRAAMVVLPVTAGLGLLLFWRQGRRVRALQHAPADPVHRAA